MTRRRLTDHLHACKREGLHFIQLEAAHENDVTLVCSLKSR